MPHILAGPTYAKAGETLTMRVTLRGGHYRGGFVLECAEKDGFFRSLIAGLRRRPRCPVLWSPLVIPTAELLLALEREGRGVGATVHGAVCEEAPEFAQRIVAPFTAHYRLTQEATHFCPTPTVKADLRVENVSIYQALRRKLARR